MEGPGRLWEWVLCLFFTLWCAAYTHSHVEYPGAVEMLPDPNPESEDVWRLA